MAFWSSTFLNKRRNNWLQSIVSAQYRIGTTWYDGTIVTKTINGDSISIIVNLANIPAGSQTVAEVRLLDDNGDVAGDKTDSITKTGTQGILLKFDYPLKEV